MVLFIWCLIAVVPYILYLLFDVIFFYAARRLGLTYNIRRCGSWAIVTGGGQGIGRGYALALARRGLNVCLVGRTESYLRATAKEVETTYGVKTLTVVHDFSVKDAGEMEDRLKSSLAPLLPEVAILVNNVGTMGDAKNFAAPFLTHTPSTLQFARNMIATNVDSAVFMTALVAPALVAKKRGVIIYLGSACAISPIYGEAVYSATKAFIEFFGDAIRQELEPHGLFVTVHSPSFVKTKLIPKLAYDLFPNILAPAPHDVAESALDMIGVQRATDGCWQHSLQNNGLRFMTRWAPKRILDWFLMTSAATLRVMNDKYKGGSEQCHTD